MAETSPSAASSPSFDIYGAQAVVEWAGLDAQPRCLYHGSSDPSLQVTFELRFDATSGAASFEVRAPVGLKAAGHQKTPLYLYIPPHRITSLSSRVPDAIPDAVIMKLGPRPSRLQFNLTQPADMVAPLVSLSPQNKGHGDMLDSLKLVAQETRFSVYFAQADMSEAHFRPLCDAVAARTLKSMNAAADLRGLYEGAGGKVLKGAELYILASKIAPPSYSDLVPSPPEAHVKLGMIFVVCIMGFVR